MFTLEQTKAAVKAAVEAHPDQINAYELRTVSGLPWCVYNLDGVHCIAAQVYLDMVGVECANASRGVSGHFGFTERFEADAIIYLQDVQNRFDSATCDQVLHGADGSWKTTFATMMWQESRAELE